MSEAEQPAPEPPAAPVRRLLVIGGAEDKRRRVVVLKRFVALAGGRSARIVVIPTASSLAHEAVDVYTGVFDRLHAQGTTCVDPASRAEAADPDLVAVIDAATGVFVTGGNQLRLGQLIVGTPLDAAIRRAYDRGAVIAGTSAGASILSQFMISLGDEGVTPRQRASQLTAGLGLLPGVILDQHFAQRTRYARLLSLIASSPSLLGVGIDEDTAAEIVDEQILTVVGAGAVYVVDGRAAVSDAPEAGQDAPLLVSGAVVHSLPDGATFDLRQCRLVDFAERHGDPPVAATSSDDHDTANSAAALQP